MAFKEIKSQEEVVEYLRSCINKERLAHAYLFLGPQGVGKTLLAKNLAKFLNCENPVKEGDLFLDCCDQCTSCRKIDNFNHPDVHWIEKESKSKQISIDEIRAMQRKIYLKAYEGKFKVFVIQDAHYMSEQAANSLLKTLEEPPSQSLIILISDNIGRLLATIVSRCQIIRFSPCACAELEKILIEDYGYNSSSAHFLSVVSEGRIGQALSLPKDDAFSKKNRLIDQICQTGRQFSSVDMFDIKDKKELAFQMSYLLHWFRDILIYKTAISTSWVINIDRIKSLSTSANLFSIQDLEQIIAKIDEAHRLIEQNVNPKIALEVMLVEITKCKK